MYIYDRLDLPLIWSGISLDLCTCTFSTNACFLFVFSAPAPRQRRRRWWRRLICCTSQQQDELMNKDYWANKIMITTVKTGVQTTMIDGFPSLYCGFELSYPLLQFWTEVALPLIRHTSVTFLPSISLLTFKVLVFSWVIVDSNNYYIKLQIHKKAKFSHQNKKKDHHQSKTQCLFPYI